MEQYNTVGYRCPNCSADLKFNIEKQGFSCDYCESFFTKKQLEEFFPEMEFAPLNAAQTEKVDESAAIDEFAQFNSFYQCPGCGASVVTSDKNTASTFCHYCHSPIVLAGRLSGEYKPDRLIPFKTTKDDALQSFEKWCGKKFFLPKNFRQDARLSYINALYVPFWLTDVSMNADIQATCETATMLGTKRHVRVYECHRRAFMFFRNVPADSSKRIDDTLMSSIEPFYYNEMVPFAMSYLSGIDAEKYDVDKALIIPQLSASLGKEAVSLVESKLRKNFSSVHIENANAAPAHINWLNTLLPVWFMNYRYKDRDYSFAMNGQTGKISGSLPVNKLKLFLASLLVMLGVGLFLTGIYILIMLS